MAKRPSERPASMDEVVSELEAVRTELDTKDGGEPTMIVKARPAAKPPRVRAPRKRVPVLALLLGALLVATVIGGILLAVRNGDDPVAASGGEPLKLAGVASFDPQGDDKEEHPEQVGEATDGDPATAWTTSTYEDFSATKDGVGLVLDAGEAREVAQIAVTTDTPGFTAEIRAGSSPEGPFDTVGASKTVGASTVWDLEGPDARYYVVWITDLDRLAHVNEVRAS
jgi:hypothetical protein